MSSTSNRRSGIFSSFKDKLSRKSSTRSTASAEPPSPSVRAGPAASLSRAGVNPNPLANPSPPTRRPRNEPPPPYSEAPAGPTISEPAAPAPVRASSPAPSGASAMSMASITTPEDPYAFLSTFDTIFLIDDSGSMAGRSWREVKEALRAIAPICTAHDKDGIDVYFLNAKNSRHPQGGYCNITNAEQVEALFNQVRPSAATPTGMRINNILKPYLRQYEQKVAANGGDADNTGVKPVNMIVITDGVPTDDPESVIISLATKLDKIEAPPYQVGIQFFQVGNEAGAAEALRELDDSLGSMAGVRDMVDTVTWNAKETNRRALSADDILKVVLGAVVKRLDRRRASGESRRRDLLAP